MKSRAIRDRAGPDSSAGLVVTSPDARTIEVYVQYLSALPNLPAPAFFEDCVRNTLAGRRADAQVTIRLVDPEESRALNLRWRGIDRPTNVLSFPMDGISDVAPHVLGDLAICAPLVCEEADAQGKSREAHWAHLTVHGTLHLVGWDHEREADATAMEETERDILAAMGHPDPYVL